ncbi:MAG TPA: hypothetical protein DCR93_08360, partial [Cytophagales bacterium]|nr:hypothetical protein [Cytophagales bacterium]
VNYVNLTTSRSLKRAMEVGLRKVVGAWRSQLIHQFLVESFLMVFLSTLLALSVTVLALPVMQRFLGVPFTLDFLTTTEYLIWIGLGMVGLTLLAGFYPALILSGFHPLQAFRAMGKHATNRSPMRSGLVVFQFALAILLLTGTVGTIQQINYLKTKDLGYSREALVSVEISDDYSQGHLESMKAMLNALPEVASISVNSSVPTEDQFWTWEFYPVGEAQAAGTATSLKSLGVDGQFLDTYSMELAYGEGLDDFSGTEHGFLLNAEAARRFGWDPDNPEEILSRQLGFTWYNGADPVTWEGPVQGLLKDFHFESLYESIDPLILYQVQPGSHFCDYLTVKLNPGTLGQGMAALETAWNEFHPTLPLDAYFMDDALESQYQKEERLGQTFIFFACISLMLCLLGLVGLAAYTALQRTKEFGIRKVMGARVPQILQLLYKEFSRYILLGFIVGWPLAALWLWQWLSSFAYQMSLGPIPFAVAGGFTLLMAILVITSQTWRSATRNPVESLRYE